jgi:hypothetical protein
VPGGRRLIGRAVRRFGRVGPSDGIAGGRTAFGLAGVRDVVVRRTAQIVGRRTGVLIGLPDRVA